MFDCRCLSGCLAGRRLLTPRIPAEWSWASADIAVDAAIAARIEREFRRLGTYVTVDGPEHADLVFLVEVTYATIGSSTTDLTSYTGGTGRASVTVSGAGNWEPNLIQSALAMVVPAAAYRAGGTTVQSLLAARTWEGSSLLVPPFTYRRIVPRDEADGSRSSAIIDQSRKNWTSASPEALVRQFHDKEKRPSSHPALCQASNGPVAVQVTRPASGRGTKASRATLAEVGAAAGAEQQANPDTAATATASTFRSAVTYVSLPLVVTDAAGRPVLDLKPVRDPGLRENDAPQALDRLMTAQEPFDIALAIDTSDSMRARREDAKSAAMTLIDALPAGNRILLASFGRAGLRRIRTDGRPRSAPKRNQAAQHRGAHQAVQRNGSSSLRDGCRRCRDARRWSC